MISLGLKDRELADLRRLLKSPHWIKITVQILDLDHNRIDDISDRMLSGQVDFDTSGEVTRSLEMELSDPNETLSLNPDSPEEGAVFVDKMIKVVYSVAPPAPSYWYDIPVFVGPIMTIKRNSHSVSVSCKGKDSLGFVGVWNGRTFKKGQKVSDVIRSILKSIMGESRMAIPDKPARIHKQLVVGSGVVPWTKAKQLAGSLNLNLFYDGRGIAQARPGSAGSMHTFDDSNITSDVTFSYDPTTVVNAVRVIGGKPRGKKQKAKAAVVAPAGHPLSPVRLGRHIPGEDGSPVLIPRYYPEIIQDSSLKTDKACRQRAEKVLEAKLRESLNVEFSAVPNPLMEEIDNIRVDADGDQIVVRPVQWSLPLTHDGQMSVGVLKKVSWKVKRKGKAKGKHKGRGGKGPGRIRTARVTNLRSSRVR